MERGEVNSIADFTSKEGLSDRFVSLLLRPAWLQPNIPERLVVRRKPCSTCIYDLSFVAFLP